MVACATEVTARLRAECFDRPLRLRDGHLFLDHFPALRAGLSPSGTSPHRTILALKLTRLGSRQAAAGPLPKIAPTKPSRSPFNDPGDWKPKD
jgi:hypothetical protein